MEDTLDPTERMIVARVFDAPRELVWQAWTEPNHVMKWWGPQGFTVPVCKMDFRAGGKFLVCMRTPDGQDFWNAGVYREIVPNEKIVLSMYFADADGDQVESAHYGIEHEAIGGAHDEVLFEDLGDSRTKLTYIGNESMQEATKSGQLEGWNQVLDKFAAVVEGLARAK